MPTDDAYSYQRDRIECELTAARSFLAMPKEHQFFEVVQGIPDDDFRLRVAQILADTNRAASDPDVSRRFFQMAFMDVDERVRGTAWSAIAESCRSSIDRGQIAQIAAEVLAQHFAFPTDWDSAELTVRTGRWLQCLVFQVDISRLRDDVQISEGVTGVVDEEKLSQLAAQDLEVLETDVGAALRFLRHPFPDRRQAALMIMSRRANINPSECEAVLELAIGDLDASVRRSAITAMYTMYGVSSQSRVKQVFATIAMNALEAEQLRVMAYIGLLIIDDKPIRTSPISEEGRMSSLFDDIDWQYVVSCQIS